MGAQINSTGQYRAIITLLNLFLLLIVVSFHSEENNAGKSMPHFSTDEEKQCKFIDSVMYVLYLCILLCE